MVDISKHFEIFSYEQVVRLSKIEVIAYFESNFLTGRVHVQYIVNYEILVFHF